MLCLSGAKSGDEAVVFERGQEVGPSGLWIMLGVGGDERIRVVRAGVDGVKSGALADDAAREGVGEEGDVAVGETAPDKPVGAVSVVAVTDRFDLDAVVDRIETAVGGLDWITDGWVAATVETRFREVAVLVGFGIVVGQVGQAARLVVGTVAKRRSVCRTHVLSTGSQKTNRGHVKPVSMGEAGSEGDDLTAFQQQVLAKVLQDDPPSISASITDTQNAVLITAEGDDAAFTAAEARDAAARMRAGHKQMSYGGVMMVVAAEYIEDLADVVDGEKTAADVEAIWEDEDFE